MRSNEPKTESPPIRKRHRYQYRLRTLLVVMLLASIGMSWFAVKRQQVRRQMEALEAIRELGGHVNYEYQWNGSGSPNPNAKPSQPGWLRSALGGDFFDRVTVISICDSRITDDDLRHLEGMHYLKSLVLMDDHITDAGLKHLNGMIHLQQLFLTRTRVTDAGLVELKGLSELQQLGLDGTQITDAGLVHLKKLSQLQVLLLARTGVTEEGMEKLQQALPNCRIIR